MFSPCAKSSRFRAIIAWADKFLYNEDADYFCGRRDDMVFGLKIKNSLFILLGAAIFAFGLVHFNMQNNLAEGGFTGITLLLYFCLVLIRPSPTWRSIFRSF